MASEAVLFLFLAPKPIETANASILNANAKIIISNIFQFRIIQNRYRLNLKPEYS